MNGNVPCKEANTYSTIEELKEHFATPKDGGDEKARLKITHALEVKGAAAWIVHNAAKRNYDAHRKGTGFVGCRIVSGILTYNTESHAALERARSETIHSQPRQGCWASCGRGEEPIRYPTEIRTYPCEGRLRNRNNPKPLIKSS